MKKYLIPILVFLISTATCYSQINVEIPRGKSAGGFTFTRDGVLKYKGREFSPSVKLGEDVKSFGISFLPEKALAGAIARYSAEGEFFLLDTRKFTSSQPEGISVPTKMFWSPSRNFLVIYGEYESAGLYSINLATRKVRQNPDWFPAYDLWVISNTPKWIGKSDVLAFKVVLGCDPTADPSNPCGGKADIPVYYNVQIDAATLKMKNKKLTGRKNSR